MGRVLGLGPLEEVLASAALPVTGGEPRGSESRTDMSKVISLLSAARLQGWPRLWRKAICTMGQHSLQKR